MARNPSIKTQRGKRVDSVRLNGATRPVITAWFKYLALPAIRLIKPENRWNKDETGIMEGQGSNGLVLGSSEHRALIKKQPGSRNWTTFVECISAKGRSLPPLVIMKGKTIQQQHYPRKIRPFADWKFTAGPKGWIDDEKALEWLHKIFIPRTRTRNNERRLLIVDGHHSHTTDDYMWTCFENNIQLLFLPAHSSHVLQPLDMSVFSVLKRAYRRELGNIPRITDGTVVGRRIMLQCYHKARAEALDPDICTSGWSASGLWPVNKKKPLSNPLLLENNNKASISKQAVARQEEQDLAHAQIDFLDGFGVWKTPRKVEELTIQLAKININSEGLRTRRMLFRKIGKAYNHMEFDLAAMRRENEALKAEIENKRGNKRKKVELSPNSKFASIADIRRAQRAAGDEIDSSDESEVSDLSEMIESCIEVGCK
jgi:4-hydroxybenzoate polyprenyltransferase